MARIEPEPADDLMGVGLARFFNAVIPEFTESWGQAVEHIFGEPEPRAAGARKFLGLPPLTGTPGALNKRSRDESEQTAEEIKAEIGSKLPGLFKSQGISETTASRISEALEGMEVSSPVWKPVLRVISYILSRVAVSLGVVMVAKEEGQQSTLKAVPITLPGVGDVLRYLWREGDAKIASEIFSRLGYSKERLGVFEVGSRPVLGPQEIAALHFRRQFAVGLSPLAPDEAWGKPSIVELAEGAEQGLRRLKHLGYDSDSADLLMRAHRPISGLSEAFELWRRGEIGDGQLQRAVGALGYDSHEAELLAKLRFRLPNEFDTRLMLHREQLDRRTALAYLTRLGYTQGDARRLAETWEVLPSPQDLVRFGVREVFTPAVSEYFGQGADYPTALTAEAARLGMSERTMRQFWAAHWDLPAPGQGFQMFHRKIITGDELDLLLRALDVMPFWRGRLRQLSYGVIPRRAIAKLIKQGLLSYTESHDAYEAVGFSPGDAHKFTLSVIRDVGEQDRELTKGELLTAYKFGEYNAETTTERLKALGYSDLAIEWQLRYADLTRTDRQRIAASGVTDAEAEEIKGLSKAEVIDGYARHMLKRDEAEAHLAALGYSAVARVFYLDRADLKREQAGRDLTARQVEEIFKSDGIDENRAVAELTSIGYDPAESRLLVNQWAREQIADDLKSRRPTRKPEKSDLNRWLQSGLLGPQEWVEEMRGLGYGTRHIRLYLSELWATM